MLVDRFMQGFVRHTSALILPPFHRFCELFATHGLPCSLPAVLMVVAKWTEESEMWKQMPFLGENIGCIVVVIIINSNSNDDNNITPSQSLLPILNVVFWNFPAEGTFDVCFPVSFRLVFCFLWSCESFSWFWASKGDTGAKRKTQKLGPPASRTRCTGAAGSSPSTPVSAHLPFGTRKSDATSELSHRSSVVRIRSNTEETDQSQVWGSVLSAWCFWSRCDNVIITFSAMSAHFLTPKGAGPDT